MEWQEKQWIGTTDIDIRLLQVIKNGKLSYYGHTCGKKWKFFVERDSRKARYQDVEDDEE